MVEDRATRRAGDGGRKKKEQVAVYSTRKHLITLPRAQRRGCDPNDPTTACRAPLQRATPILELVHQAEASPFSTFAASGTHVYLRAIPLNMQ